MLLSHKVIFELGLKCCFMNMMKWPFKVFSEEQILQGLLEPTPLRYITLGEEGKRGQREIERERTETASKRENTLKPKCKKELR